MLAGVIESFIGTFAALITVIFVIMVLFGGKIRRMYRISSGLGNNPLLTGLAGESEDA